MFTTKEIPEISNGRTKVHHVGPFAAVNAVMMWGAAVALLVTIVAMATTEWATGKSDIRQVHTGLWRTCIGSVCVDVHSAQDLPDWFKAVQAMVCLSFIASVAAVGLAVVYTFVHSVSKTVVLLLFIVASAVSAIVMIIGFSVFADKAKELGMNFGYSFYLAIVSSVIHILVAVVGGIQTIISYG